MRFTHSEADVKLDYLARRRMGLTIVGYLNKVSPAAIDFGLIALEDYDQNPHQQVAYQIAETAAVLKHELYSWGVPVMLVNPSKLKSFVQRKRGLNKNDIIAWAESQGFPLPAKKPGKEGLYKRQREDLADAYVLYRMALVAYDYLMNGVEPPEASRSIFLDPEKGLCTRKDLILNKDLIT